MTSVAVIPARGGSRRIPRKNIREFHGKPIIAYSIQTALASGIFNQVIVSSDDSEILKAAETYGAIPYRRPKHLGEDDIGTQQIMRDALIHFPAYKACCIYPCAPLLLPGDLKYAQSLHRDCDFDYIVSVGYPPLHDAGAFYFGYAEAFLFDRPLFTHKTGLYQLPTYRDCDINTEEDWQRALDLYAFMVCS